jgi:hypothetical protein
MTKDRCQDFEKMLRNLARKDKWILTHMQKIEQFLNSNFEQIEKFLQELKESGVLKIYCQNMGLEWALIIFELCLKWFKTSVQKSLLTKQQYYFLPEDWYSNITSRLQRLHKAKKSKWFIKFKTAQYLLELLWAAVQIKWQNFWLPKNEKLEK